MILEWVGWIRFRRVNLHVLKCDFYWPNCSWRAEKTISCERQLMRIATQCFIGSDAAAVLKLRFRDIAEVEVK
jgi:hypothetical protein